MTREMEVVYREYNTGAAADAQGAVQQKQRRLRQHSNGDEKSQFV